MQVTTTLRAMVRKGELDKCFELQKDLAGFCREQKPTLAAITKKYKIQGAPEQKK